ncbi:MAG TPA: Uma2 family endonuclease [Cyclobacteriaceae bacterium]|nr:Uma2 family endonuclease [Cytophagales bacterium]HMR55959.1 Uma2 family endonuclease [Cyclobacteriaceae bacterium]HRE68319.1 Uma2 family endonuclease [Cyclobacteriaceae bacterium]HRF34899.1 Uma2 family endonuclease [Cyclobacteriaceae bacterium]
MQEAVLHPPRTLLEVFRMLPEGTRAELIENSLYMSPAPTVTHQDIIVSLASQIYVFTKKKKLGKTFVAPVDVFLNPENAFQPDILFISKKNTGLIKEDGIYGAPDLVIEVLSPGSKKLDLTKKKDVYEAAGVREYWVVDPATKVSQGFHLVKKKYEPLNKEKGKLTSALLKQTFKF